MGWAGWVETLAPKISQFKSPHGLKNLLFSINPEHDFIQAGNERF